MAFSKIWPSTSLPIALPSKHFRNGVCFHLRRTVVTTSLHPIDLNLAHGGWRFPDSWGYPDSWMVYSIIYNGKNHQNGYPQFSKPPMWLLRDNVMWFSIWQNNMFCLADTHLFRGRPKKQSFGMGSGGFLEWGYPQTISNHPVMDDHDLVLKPMTWEYTISRNPHFLRDNKKALLGWQTMFFWRGHNSSFRPRNILWYGDMEVSYIGGWPWLSIETTCRWLCDISFYETRISWGYNGIFLGDRIGYRTKKSWGPFSLSTWFIIGT